MIVRMTPLRTTKRKSSRAEAGCVRSHNLPPAGASNEHIGEPQRDLTWVRTSGDNSSASRDHSRVAERPDRNIVDLERLDWHRRCLAHLERLDLGNDGSGDVDHGPIAQVSAAANSAEPTAQWRFDGATRMSQSTATSLRPSSSTMSGD